MSVGYRLYRQIRDFAPRDWTSGELVVAFIIADSANEESRRSYLDNPELCRRSRMTEGGVRKALQRLAERGFEFRVSKGKDKHGKEIYAASGKRVEYQVPDIFMLLERGAAVAYGLVDKLAEGGTTVPPRAGLSTRQGGTVVPLRRYHGTASGEAMPFAFDLKPSKPPQPNIGNCPHTCSWNRARARKVRPVENMTSGADEKFAGWVILELMGHRRLIGFLTEQEIAGKALLRIDILTEPPATQFYGTDAIYCITPTTEEMAHRAAKLSRVAPIERWELPPARPLTVVEDDDDLIDDLEYNSPVNGER